MEWNKGELNPAKRPEVKEKIRIAKLGKPRLDLREKYMGNGNPNWKGDNAGYSALHAWIKRRLGKVQKCEKCGKTNGIIEWANKSGLYKRDISDWIRLCRSCHSKEHRGKEWHKWIKQFKNKKQ